MNKILKNTLGAATLLSAFLLSAPTTALADVSIYYSTGNSYNRHAYQRNPYRRYNKHYSYSRPYYGFGNYKRRNYGYGYPDNHLHYDRKHLHRKHHDRRHERRHGHRDDHRRNYRNYRERYRQYRD